MMCACVRVCMCACVHVCACVRVCMRMCVRVHGACVNRFHRRSAIFYFVLEIDSCFFFFLVIFAELSENDTITQLYIGSRVSWPSTVFVSNAEIGTYDFALLTPTVPAFTTGKRSSACTCLCACACSCVHICSLAKKKSALMHVCACVCLCVRMCMFVCACVFE